MRKPKAMGSKGQGAVTGRGRGPMAAGPKPNTNDVTLPPRKIGPLNTQPVIGEKAGGARPAGGKDIPVRGMHPASVPSLPAGPFQPMVPKGGTPVGSGGAGKFKKGGVPKPRMGRK